MGDDPRNRTIGYEPKNDEAPAGLSADEMLNWYLARHAASQAHSQQEQQRSQVQPYSPPFGMSPAPVAQMGLQPLMPIAPGSQMSGPQGQPPMQLQPGLFPGLAPANPMGHGFLQQSVTSVIQAPTYGASMMNPLLTPTTAGLQLELEGL